MVANERVPMCPICEAGKEETEVADEPLEEHYEEIPFLTEQRDIERFETGRTELRHRVPLKGVKAEYRRPQSGDPMDCSMPGKHRHWHGYVVETLCGLTLRIGVVCGRDTIVDFGRVENRTARSREYQGFLSSVRTQLQDLRQRYGDAVERERRIWAFRRYLNDELPGLVKDFAQHWRERRVKTAAEQIAGIELWDYARPEVSTLGPDLRELEIEAGGWGDVPPAWSTQQGFRDRVRRLDRKVNDFLDWARRASVLLTREGMARACVVLDSRTRTESVEVFDASLGRMVTRQNEVFRRVYERYNATNEGIVDDDGRVTPVRW